jgi:hypothetical protein
MVWLEYEQNNATVVRWIIVSAQAGSTFFLDEMYYSEPSRA